MKLPIGERLLACCSYVNQGDRVADIGCDHGYLSIHLLTQGIARSVIAHDDVVDRGFDQVKRTLIEQLGKPETDGEAALDLLMIAKYFERIGDHAVNIAQWVLFSMTGSREGGTV